MQPTEGRVFISYRRQETAWPARQLYEALVAKFGPDRVFKDVDNIAPGEDFVAKIESEVEASHVLLALVGPTWATITDDQGRRRIDDPDDFVRIEVATALARGVLVVPILVDGAKLPSAADLPPDLAPLARRQAVEIVPTGFNLDRLFVAVDDALARSVPGPVASTSSATVPAATVAEPVEAISAVPAGPVAEPVEATPAVPAATVAEPVEATPTAPIPAPWEQAPPPPPPSVVELGDTPPPNRVPVIIGALVGLAVLLGGAALYLYGPWSPGGVVVPTTGAPATPDGSATPEASLTPSVTAPTPAAPIDVSLTLTGSDGWRATGVACTPGLVLSLEATGVLRPAPATGQPNPDGTLSEFSSANPVPGAPTGALVGRLQAGGSPSDAFFVGDTRTLSCDTDSALELGVNAADPSTSTDQFSIAIASVDIEPGDLGIVEVEVPSNVSWTPSGFTCTTGETYRVSATGIAGPRPPAGPDGVRLPPDGAPQPGTLAKDFAQRALLGRIDEGDPFLVGSSATLTCQADGEVELGPNDVGVDDNEGTFQVILSNWP